MKEILLTQGSVAIVDDDQYERVSEYKWTVDRRNNRRCCYAYRKDKKKTIYLHRFILGIADPDVCVDHINGDGLDCRIENMRQSSHAENMCNRETNAKNNTTGFKGVSWDKRRKKYSAKISVAGKTVHIGRFVDPTEAARAYDEMARKYHGKFARLNGA